MQAGIDAAETVEYILAGSKMLAGTAYMEYHSHASVRVGNPNIIMHDTTKGAEN